MAEQQRLLLTCSALGLAVMVTAIACIYSKHESRKMFVELFITCHQSVCNDDASACLPTSKWGRLPTTMRRTGVKKERFPAACIIGLKSKKKEKTFWCATCRTFPSPATTVVCTARKGCKGNLVAIRQNMKMMIDSNSFLAICTFVMDTFSCRKQRLSLLVAVTRR